MSTNHKPVLLKPFLESAAPTLTHIEPEYTYILSKSPMPGFESEIVMLHVARMWNHTEMYSSDMAMAFAGLYIPATGVLWYEHLYELMEISNPEAEGMPTDSIVEHLNRLRLAAGEIVNKRLAENTPFPVTENSEKPHYTMAEWKVRGMREDVHKGFMNRTKPEIYCILGAVPAKFKYWQKIAESILNPDTVAQQIADEHCEEAAAYYNMAMEQKPLVAAAIAEIEADPTHPMQMRRKLSECVDPANMKTVTVTLCREGHTIIGKVEADSVYRLRNGNSLYTSNLDPKARSEWKSLFKWADIEPEDIASITYGKKTLYTKEA